ncbi:MAG TPA: glycosyltransferase family 2 protein [Gammaproteobacteria bacterium]|nr:glycosyltransferase family 2 protein [Gammaproteobacteria bacterium]
MSTLSLSIAAPAYNEAGGILKVIERWHDWLKKQNNILAFEIVICNDGSQDDTGAILDALQKKYPEVRPIHFEKNQGAAAALAAAISKTQFDWVLLMDADDQFPIENLSLLLAALQGSSAKAVMGIRNKKGSFLERVGSSMSGRICNITHGTKIRDFNSAFKLVSGPLLRSFRLEAKGMNYSTEITSRLIESKTDLLEVHIHHQARQTGKSNVRLLRDGMHRLLFVSYISFRQLLIKFGILRRSL